MSELSVRDGDAIKRGTSDRWLHKTSGAVVFVDAGYDFSINKDWFKIPEEAKYATYSNNSIRHDVLLFWRNQEFSNYGLTVTKNCFDPTLPKNSWFKAESLEDFLTKSTYKGRIVWSRD